MRRALPRMGIVDDFGFPGPYSITTLNSVLS